MNFKFKKSGARLPTLVVLPLKVERTIRYSLKCFKIGVLQYVRNWSTFSAPLHKVCIIIVTPPPPPPLKKIEEKYFFGFTVVISKGVFKGSNPPPPPPPKFSDFFLKSEGK